MEQSALGNLSMHDEDLLSIRESRKNTVARYITRDSPFFPLYVGETTLDQILHIEGIGNELERSKIDFSTALQAFFDMSGWTREEMAKHAKIRDPGFLSRLIHRKGPLRPITPITEDGEREAYAYRDMRFPPTTPKIVFSMASFNPFISFIEQEKPVFKEQGGRIPWAYYDLETGDLALSSNNLRRRAEQGINYSTRLAQDFLQGPRSSALFSARAEYLQRVADEKFTFLKQQQQPIFIPSDDIYLPPQRRGKALTRADLVLRHKTKLGITLRRATSLNLVPVYLLCPPSEEEIMDNARKIQDHISSYWSNLSSLYSTRQ